MSIAAGTRLGSYEVVALIGAGGMGEVYRAHDTKLARDVAIKVLPANFVNDPERLSRFQREARMLAALNHANIATIYGLEQSGGVTCLVMELVPGETLAERVKAGPLPIEEALKIAVQIAEALEAAHEKNIIHRDLKPANVKLTLEGKVKVLDFGLAKAFEGDSTSEDIGNSPTLSHAATMQGVILGTAAYMSPEQARGKMVDKRTDIWAFGCVLYELLSGQQAFHGEDTTEILAAVVKSEPDWTALPENTPPDIRVLLRRCLQKDKLLRLRDAGDARIEIQDARNSPAADPAIETSGWRGMIPLGMPATLIGLALLVVGLVLGAWLRSFSAPPSRAGVVRLTMPLPGDTELSLAPSIAVSPDGRQVAVTSDRGGGVSQIFLRTLDSADLKPIPGTEGAYAIFFSPDGHRLGFIADGKLKKISTTDGVLVTLGDADSGFGGGWGPNGTIIYHGTSGLGLLEIAEAGGAPHPISVQNSAMPRVRLEYPEFLPGGKTVLFTSSTEDTDAADEKTIVALTLKTGAQKTLIQGGSYARYLPSGHLVFLRSGTLMAVPFDLDRLEVTGPPVPVLEGVRESVIGSGAYDCSETGTCAYIGGGMARRTVVLVDRTGASQPLPLPPRNYTDPKFSPAGDKASLWVEQQNCQVALYDFARAALSRFTDNGDDHFPIWTPDGKRVTYISRKGFAGEGYSGSYGMYWKSADGSGPEENLAPGAEGLRPLDHLSWSPDGKMLVFSNRGGIWGLSLSGDRKAALLIPSKFDESMPAVSPDGRWLAYVSNESGRPEVYVSPFPGPGAKYLVSNGGGTEPVWARNGRELFYRSDDRMMAVPVTTQPSFSAASPRLLFIGAFARTPEFSNYDVSPDGQHFLMLKENEEAKAATEINIVLNWFEELKQKVPTGKR